MAGVGDSIAFIGLGAMGFGMATNLVKRGYSVTGFDTWAPSTERFRESGGRIAPTPAEAVRDKQFVISCVATAQQTQDVFFNGEGSAALSLSPGTVLLIASTVPSSYARKFAQQMTNLGRDDVDLVDCPISGGIQRAANGTLSIMVGASDTAIEKSRHILAQMADEHGLYFVQGGIGAGSNMKMVHQVLASIQMLAASEAMGLAYHLGLDLSRTRQSILQSDARSFMFDHRTPRMFTNFEPVASALNIMLKDANIITSEASRCSFSPLMSSTAEQIFLLGLSQGYGKDDDSGLIRLYTNGFDHKNIKGPTMLESKEEGDLMEVVEDLLKGVHLCAAAEALAFAAHLNLDISQVLELCSNAAGGSGMLDIFGPEFKNTLSGTATGSQDEVLVSIAHGLKRVTQLAGSLKVPLFLGTQANNILQLAVRLCEVPTHASSGSLLAVWSSRKA